MLMRHGITILQMFKIVCWRGIVVLGVVFNIECLPNIQMSSENKEVKDLPYNKNTFLFCLFLKISRLKLKKRDLGNVLASCR